MIMPPRLGLMVLILFVQFFSQRYLQAARNGFKTKYIPKSPMTAPAPLRNQLPAPCQALFSRILLTIAVEAPATTIGRQWPMAKRSIRRIPAAIFC